MRERNLYRGLRNFEGGVDEEGNLYDERHMFVGRIVGNDVYDNSNIKQGSIDSNGKLWDINHTFVGEAHGNNFIGPTYQSTGMSRGDSFGEGNGCEYGALMMLKKRNEHYLGKPPDNNYNFPNDDDIPNDNDIFDRGDKARLEDESWEDDYDHDEDWDDDDEDDYEHRPPSRRGRGGIGGGRREYNDNNELVGCLSYLIGIIFVAILVGIALSYEA